MNNEYNFDNLPRVCVICYELPVLAFLLDILFWAWYLLFYQALLTLFVFATKDGWVSIMHSGVDVVGVDQQVG